MKVAKNKNKIWFGPFLFLLMKLMDVLVFVLVWLWFVIGCCKRLRNCTISLPSCCEKDWF